MSPQPFSTVVGANARRLRTEHGITLDQVARECSRRGLRWATPRAGEFERGKIPATVPVMLIVADALRQLTGTPVTLPDLVAHVGYISLHDSGALHSELFQRALSGAPIDFRDDTDLEQARADRDRDVEAAGPDNDIPHGVSVLVLQMLREVAGLADERAAKKLGMSVDAFLAYCYLTHGSALLDLTMNALPSDASPQARGHFTRQIIEDVDRYRKEHPRG